MTKTCANGSGINDDITFLSLLSHEIRTYLHGIEGVAQYLCHNWEEVEDEVVRKCVADIAKASIDLQQVANTLVRNPQKILTGGPEFNIKPVDVLPTIIDTLELCKIFLIRKQDLTLTLHSDRREYLIHADLFWIKQLLMNLIFNAIKFSERGVIAINVRRLKERGGQYMSVKISDQGEGIPEGAIAEIFNLYQTYGGSFPNISAQGDSSPGRVHGYGLGLALCEKVVTAHKGKIAARNNKGSPGAVFEFTIPEIINPLI